MFTVADRDRIRDRVLQLAESDERVVAGAVVGSLALDEGDRWSDLDLTFAVVDDCPVIDVLEDWTRSLTEEFGAVRLFDLPSGPSLYRVFLLPGCLQFDLSFTPAASFGAMGPKFRLLFGRAVSRPLPGPPAAEGLFGYAVHHALRARFCIERGRYWHAEYWISAARDYALHLACRRRGLPAYYGRGFDDLPADVLNLFRGALVASLEREELLRALGVVIEGLLREADEVQELAAQVEPQLRELAAEWPPTPDDSAPDHASARMENTAMEISSTDDPFAAVRKAGTAAGNYDLDTHAIVARLQQWHALCRFRVTEAGHDRIGIAFETLPADMDAFVRDLYDFCPDLVDQGTGCVAELLETMDEIPPALQALVEGIDFEDEDYGLEILKRELIRGKRLLLWWD